MICIHVVVLMCSTLQAFVLSFLLRRYPDFLRVGMWFGLALYFLSLFASSFATQVRADPLGLYHMTLTTERILHTGMAAHPPTRSWRWPGGRYGIHACHQTASGMVLRATRSRRGHHLLRDRRWGLRFSVRTERTSRKGRLALDAAHPGHGNVILQRNRPALYAESLPCSKIQRDTETAQADPSTPQLAEESALHQLRKSSSGSCPTARSEHLADTPITHVADCHEPPTGPLAISCSALHRDVHQEYLRPIHSDRDSRALQRVRSRRTGPPRAPDRQVPVPVDHVRQRNRLRTLRVPALGLCQRGDLPLLLRRHLRNTGA